MITVYTLLACVVCANILVEAFPERRSMEKRTALFCEPNSCGEGKCCKNFLGFHLMCLDYLKEGDRCLFMHKSKLGCGCSPGLECVRTSTFSLIFKCERPLPEEIEEIEEKHLEEAFENELKEEAFREGLSAEEEDALFN